MESKNVGTYPRCVPMFYVDDIAFIWTHLGYVPTEDIIEMLLVMRYKAM